MCVLCWLVNGQQRHRHRWLQAVDCIAPFTPPTSHQKCQYCYSATLLCILESVHQPFETRPVGIVRMMMASMSAPLQNGPAARQLSVSGLGCLCCFRGAKTPTATGFPFVDCKHVLDSSHYSEIVTPMSSRLKKWRSQHRGQEQDTSMSITT